MRRWLAILLLMFMPLQQAWAAISVYCQHESEAAANHLGHHEHRHQHASDDGGGDAGPKGLHADCGVCHAAAVAALLSKAELPVPALDASDFPAVVSLPLLEHTSKPERPKWARPA